MCISHHMTQVKHFLTSVALSVLSLMLIKVCSSLSSPCLMGALHDLFIVARALGSAELCWLGLLPEVPVKECGPKRLSPSVSPSLESLDDTSGCLGAAAEPTLDGRKRIRKYGRCGIYIIYSNLTWLTTKWHASLPFCVSDSTDSNSWLRWPPSVRHTSVRRSPLECSGNPNISKMMCLHLQVSQTKSTEYLSRLPQFFLASMSITLST